MKIKIEVEILEVAGYRMSKEMSNNKQVLASLKKLAKKYCDGTDDYFSKARMKTKTTHKIE